MTRPSSVLALMSVLSPGSMVSHIFSPRSFSDVIGSVVGDEVGSVIVSIDGEEPCGRQPVTDLGAFEASFHHVDEDAGDVVPVVGVVSDELR